MVVSSVKMSDIEETKMDTEELPVVNTDESDVESRGDGVNERWADVMDKILRIGTGPKDPLKAKKLRRKSMILLKSKTDAQLAAKRAKKPEEFEVVREGVEGKQTIVKPKQKVEDEELTLKELKKKRKEKRLMKSEFENRSRVKPDVTKRALEKSLQRIATKGVVQLFNAIRQRQVVVETKFKEVGGSEVKKEKVLKGLTKQDFLESIKTPCNRLEALKQPSASETKSKRVVQVPAPDESESKPGWSALRDDFMLGAGMKDWDKNSDTDEEQNDI